MRKSVVLLMLIFTLTEVFAQVSSDTLYLKHSRWFIGVNIGAMSSYRQLISDGSLGAEAVKGLRDSKEQPKPAFYLGLAIDYRVSERIRLSTGCFYTNPGEQGRWTKVGYGLTSPTETDPVKIKPVYSYKYIGIPVLAAYYFVRRKWSIYIETGASAELFLNETYKSKRQLLNGEHISKRYNYTTGSLGEKYTAVSFAYTLGFGVERKVSNERFVLRLQPFYKAYLTNLVHTSVPLNERLQNTGLMIGILYHINSGEQARL